MLNDFMTRWIFALYISALIALIALSFMWGEVTVYTDGGWR